MRSHDCAQARMPCDHQSEMQRRARCAAPELCCSIEALVAQAAARHASLASMHVHQTRCRRAPPRSACSFASFRRAFVRSRARYWLRACSCRASTPCTLVRAEGRRNGRGSRLVEHGRQRLHGGCVRRVRSALCGPERVESIRAARVRGRRLYSFQEPCGVGSTHGSTYLLVLTSTRK